MTLSRIKRSDLMRTMVLSILCACSAELAAAETLPLPGELDPRVKRVMYEENEVFVLKGHYGFGTTIRFQPGEQIESVSLGDSVAWQIVPNRTRDLLFIKPIEEQAATNMTVITDQRLYHFELSAHENRDQNSPDLMFELAFQYPEPPVQLITETEILDIPDSEPLIKPIPIPGDPGTNVDYAFKGANELAPPLIFDDGKFTYIRFADLTETPAIFTVGTERSESLVNHHERDGYIIVERVAAQFTFRAGALEACVFNQAYRGAQNLFQQDLNSSDLIRDEQIEASQTDPETRS